MRRSGRRHAGGARRAAGIGAEGLWFALMAVVLAALATLSRGGVGFAESRWVAAGAWLLGAAGIGLARPQGAEDRAAARPAKWAAGLLAAWVLAQALPLPDFALGWTWRGDGEILARVAGDARGFSIALDRFVSLHEWLLWSGLGLLAWGAGKSLGSRASVLAACHGLSALGTVQTLAGVFLLDAKGWRLQGTFGSPDALGGLLAITLPVTLGLVFHHSSRARLRGQTGWRWWFSRLATDWTEWIAPALAGAFAIQAAGMLFTGSIGATLSALAASLPLAAWRAAERPELRRWLALAGGALAVLAIVFAADGHRKNVLERTLLDTEGTRISQYSRIEIWRSAVELCRRFPLGTGPGGSALALSMFQPDTFGRVRLDYAHNDALQFWGDLGPIGGIALLALLGWTATRGWRRCRGGEGAMRSSAWARRGALGGFAAALLHSLAEFNLSARPGVQVAFALACGVLLARGRAEDGSEDSAEGEARNWLRAAGWMAAGCAAACLSLTAAWAWRLHEGALRGLGLAENEPGWFSDLELPASEASVASELAVRLAPCASAIQRGRALVEMALHRRQVEAAAARLLPSEEEGGGEVGGLDPMVPAHRRALAVAELAARVEEKAALGRAQAAADAAVGWAPWDGLARLTRAQASMGLAKIEGPGGGAERLGRRDLEIAARLYPEDAGILADACAVLSMVGREEDRERLMEWGRRAMALDPTLAGRVFQAWRTAGVDTARMMEGGGQPTAVLWQLYALLDRQQRTAEARQCLEAIAEAMEGEVAPAASALWTGEAWKQWEMRRARQRMRWTREALKHALEAGDWAAVRGMETLRRQAIHEQIRSELDADLGGSGGETMRRLRLREWAAQGQLPAKWLAEWALMELEMGWSAKALQEPLAELLLMGELDEEDLERLHGRIGEMEDAPMLADWLAAKEEERRGDVAGALARLGGWLEEKSVPRRFAHRLWLWQAGLLARQGDGEGADEALARAVELCPTDPDATGATGWGGADTEELDLRFRGGRIRLKRIWIEEPAEGRPTGLLRLEFRFHGKLPADLKAHVRIRDADGVPVGRKTIGLDEVPEARYNRGAPALGSAWLWTVPLPRLAAEGDRLEIALLSGGRRVPSDERLSILGMDMGRLPRRGRDDAEETVEQKPAGE